MSVCVCVFLWQNKITSVISVYSNEVGEKLMTETGTTEDGTPEACSLSRSDQKNVRGRLRVSAVKYINSLRSLR